ncbi:NIPSNAP family protein [Sphingopyxis sp. CCNWLW253]|uniref:NIPSNAP family protein n=1 Tax=unclassified Sphingopyxis TaxID=2614943 RepID=UPI003012B447
MIHEYRVYKAIPGKLDAVRDRFLQHTLRFFSQHGIEVTGIFQPDGVEHELHYMTRFASLAARDEAFAAFQGDAEWQKIKRESEIDGPLLAEQTVTLLTPVSRT